MEKYIWFLLGGYLSGSVMYAYVIPKITRHIDIREVSEDGNPGTYNAFKYGGFLCGVCVLLAELFKGFLPTWLCARNAGVDSLWFALVMVAPVLGHACPVFFHGRGGKAIAVSFGVMLGLFPEIRPLVLLIVCYLLFSLIFKVPDHGKRSIVTYTCFAVASVFLVKVPSIRMGNLFIAGTVIYKHTVAGWKEKSRIALGGHGGLE